MARKQKDTIRDETLWKQSEQPRRRVWGATVGRVGGNTMTNGWVSKPPSKNITQDPPRNHRRTIQEKPEQGSEPEPTTEKRKERPAPAHPKTRHRQKKNCDGPMKQGTPRRGEIVVNLGGKQSQVIKT